MSGEKLSIPLSCGVALECSARDEGWLWFSLRAREGFVIYACVAVQEDEHLSLHEDGCFFIRGVMFDIPGLRLPALKAWCETHSKNFHYEETGAH